MLFRSVKKNKEFINNPIFKLLPIINGISAFVQSNEKNFEEYFTNYCTRDKTQDKQKKQSKSETKLLGNKRKEEKISNTINNKSEKKAEKLEEIVDPKVKQLDEEVNILMKNTKMSREQVLKALYGTNNNIEHAYFYLIDSEKYGKFYFRHNDDYIMKNLKDEDNYQKIYQKVLKEKGEELIKERASFLGIKI